MYKNVSGKGTSTYKVSFDVTESGPFSQRCQMNIGKMWLSPDMSFVQVETAFGIAMSIVQRRKSAKELIVQLAFLQRDVRGIGKKDPYFRCDQLYVGNGVDFSTLSGYASGVSLLINSFSFCKSHNQKRRRKTRERLRRRDLLVVMLSSLLDVLSVGIYVLKLVDRKYNTLTVINKSVVIVISINIID